jgi:hypothetical protein
MLRSCPCLSSDLTCVYALCGRSYPSRVDHLSVPAPLPPPPLPTAPVDAPPPPSPSPPLSKSSSPLPASSPRQMVRALSPPVDAYQEVLSASLTLRPMSALMASQVARAATTRSVSAPKAVRPHTAGQPIQQVPTPTAHHVPATMLFATPGTQAGGSTAEGDRSAGPSLSPFTLGRPQPTKAIDSRVYPKPWIQKRVSSTSVRAVPPATTAAPAPSAAVGLGLTLPVSSASPARSMSPPHLSPHRGITSPRSQINGSTLTPVMLSMDSGHHVPSGNAASVECVSRERCAQICDILAALGLPIDTARVTAPAPSSRSSSPFPRSRASPYTDASHDNIAAAILHAPEHVPLLRKAFVLYVRAGADGCQVVMEQWMYPDQYDVKRASWQNHRVSVHVCSCLRHNDVACPSPQIRSQKSVCTQGG